MHDETIPFEDFELSSEDIKSIASGEDAMAIIVDALSEYFDSGNLDSLDEFCVSGYPDEASISVGKPTLKSQSQSELLVHVSVYFSEKTPTSCDDHFLRENHRLDLEILINLESGRIKTVPIQSDFPGFD